MLTKFTIEGNQSIKNIKNDNIKITADGKEYKITNVSVKDSTIELEFDGYSYKNDFKAKCTSDYNFGFKKEDVKFDLGDADKFI